jgi:ring-1,2-phenylacetyl-CoA epoxidase subunit PaaE
VFHRLAVRDVRADTADSLVVTFGVPPELEADYRWMPGQHVTLRMPDVQPDVRRSYSICSKPGDPLRVGIKRLHGGRFSTWAMSTLRPGAVLDVMTPSGSFTVDCEPTVARHVVAIAAGSGITPLRSIIEAVLDGEPRSRVTLLFVNRSAADAMFLDELADMKDRFLQRFAVWHVFTREGRDIDLLSGRIDTERADELISGGILAHDADAFYLCGPIGFVESVRVALLRRGVPASRTHVELFTSSTALPAPRPTRAAHQVDVACVATVILDGRSTTVPLAPGEPVLDAALRVRSEVPYSCRSGACSTCRALLRDGHVDMAATFGLEDDELTDGYILTCQAVPTSDRVVVDYDA